MIMIWEHDKTSPLLTSCDCCCAPEEPQLTHRVCTVFQGPGEIKPHWHSELVFAYCPVLFLTGTFLKSKFPLGLSYLLLRLPQGIQTCQWIMQSMEDECPIDDRYLTSRLHFYFLSWARPVCRHSTKEAPAQLRDLLANLFCYRWYQYQEGVGNKRVIIIPPTPPTTKYIPRVLREPVTLSLHP